jgi:biotin transport system substrate-specific component
MREPNTVSPRFHSRFFPGESLSRRALGLSRVRLFQLGYLAALCLAAFVRIPLPFTPVPLTLQVLVVFSAALTLGGTASLPVILAYLLLGGAGLPVFSGAQGSVGSLMGATGGYLVGFLPMAWIVGSWIHRGSEIRLLRDSAVLAAGLIALYACGALWLKTLTGVAWSQLWAMAVAPFIVVDAIKAATAYAFFRLLQGKSR